MLELKILTIYRYFARTTSEDIPIRIVLSISAWMGKVTYKRSRRNHSAWKRMKRSNRFLDIPFNIERQLSPFSVYP